MRIPFTLAAIVALLLAGAIYLFNSPASRDAAFGAPRLTKIGDVDGVETEVAIAPDGRRYAVIASGDLWLIDIVSGSQRRLTQDAGADRFPSWTPDGQKISFTRGADIFTVSLSEGTVQKFKENAVSLSWASNGAAAFVRDHRLWLADASGTERMLVDADANPDITIRSPRFSPDSSQIAFIKSLHNVRGEVWTVAPATGQRRLLVGDRPAENPLDVAWITGGRRLAYLTNRSGGFGIWYVDFAEGAILPLTSTLLEADLAPLVAPTGIAAWRDRIAIPRRLVDSDIVLSDGSPIVGTDALELEPAVSPRGNLIAYTVFGENRFEIWTVKPDGQAPTFRAVGREPRFSPSGAEIVYTHTSLGGGQDVWRIDLRNGAAESVTDAGEVDLQPDWSRDGRTIVFASERGGAMSIWAAGAAGEKRLRLNNGGFFPRFSPDGGSILFWNRGELWIMDRVGRQERRVRQNVMGPVPAVWTKDGPKTAADPAVHKGRTMWPAFDVLPDGRFLVAPIEIQETALWAVDLTFVTE